MLLRRDHDWYLQMLLPPDVMTYFVPSCQSIYGNLGLVICSSTWTVEFRYDVSVFIRLMHYYGSRQIDVETNLISVLFRKFLKHGYAVSRTLQFPPFLFYGE